MSAAQITVLITEIIKSSGWIVIAFVFWRQSIEIKTLKAEIQNLTKLLCSILSNVNQK